MRGSGTVWHIAGFFALGLLFHCGSSDDSASGASGAPGPPTSDAGACVGVGCGGTGGSGGGSAGAPPEQEVESSFRSPVATGRYVWTANPDSSRVARIDALTNQTATYEAGFQPTYLVAVPSGAGQDRALVLNSGSQDASLFSVSSGGEVTVQSAAVHPGANAWTVSPDGRFAIAWTNFTQVPGADPTEGFQDITVLDLQGANMASTRLSVGYRPSRLVIEASGSRAFVVTEPGVTVIDLESPGPLVNREIAVSDDPLVPARDVEITPNGAFALVRREGSPNVGLVSLDDGQRTTLPLSGPVTDIDLSDDGQFAIAVVRSPSAIGNPGDGGTGDAGTTSDAADDASDAADDASDAADDAATPDGATADAGTNDSGTDASPPPPPANSEAFILPIPGVFTDPSQIAEVSFDGETVGSVAISESGTAAIFFTNATPNDRVTLLNLVAGSAGYLSYRTVALKAPVFAGFPAPDGAHAIVLLSPGAGSTKAGAFGVIPISANLPPKIQGTDAPPVAVSIMPAPSTRAIVTTRLDSAKIYATYLTRMPELQVDRIPLASPPLASGMVPQANLAFVAQEHPEGRLTFVDLASGDARTLTGFELGAKVVD